MYKIIIKRWLLRQSCFVLFRNFAYLWFSHEKILVICWLQTGTPEKFADLWYRNIFNLCEKDTVLDILPQSTTSTPQTHVNTSICVWLRDVAVSGEPDVTFTNTGGVEILSKLVRCSSQGNTAKNCGKFSTCHRKFRIDQMQRHTVYEEGLPNIWKMCEYFLS